MKNFKITFPLIILLILTSLFCTKKEVKEKTKVIDISGDLSFGKISIDTEISKTFTIKSVGTGPVIISSISSPQNFSVDWSGGTIEAGGSKDVNVKFSPSQAQSYSGEIIIQSNTSTSPNKIQVSGEGKINVADYATYTKNYFEVDNSSYIQSSLPPSSTSTSNSPKISDVQGNSYVLTGGSNIINFRSSNSISYVIIGIDGVDGYFRIDKSALTEISTNYYTFSLAISPTLILQSIKFRIAYVDINGHVSNYYVLNSSEIPAGTGLLQIHCTWQKHNDVDLHVLEPNGEEIFFGNDRSLNGGELDVDSNPNCSLDYIESENVTYKDGALVEAGVYTVRANLYSACNVTENTTVTLRARYNGVLLKDANGKTAFTINFSPVDANRKGEGSGKLAFYINISTTQTARSVFANNSIRIIPSKDAKAETVSDSYGRLIHFQFEKTNSQNTKTIGQQ